ncbi:hypothetical protein D3C71_2117930 [compost metagenome]
MQSSVRCQFSISNHLGVTHTFLLQFPVEPVLLKACRFQFLQVYLTVLNYPPRQYLLFLRQLQILPRNGFIG